MTASLQSGLYFSKALSNIWARLVSCVWQASFDCHDLKGSRISSGTFGSETGIWRLKTGKLVNSALAKLPSWMASMMARVYLSGHRLPVPYLPPVHPVLMSQQLACVSSIFWANMLAYLEGLQTMKGWPKQVEKVGDGSVTPSSVPGVLDVYPDKNQYWAWSKLSLETGGRTP
jgi:hypothetical protein